MLLSLTAVGDHLVFLVVAVETRSALAVERRLHGHMNLHKVLAVDHGDEFDLLPILGKLLYYHVILSQGLEVVWRILYLLRSCHEVFFALLSTSVHLFHLLVDYAENGIGLKLHRS